jgi:hypothetical protein
MFNPPRKKFLMKKPFNVVIITVLAAGAVGFSGCATPVGSAAADLGLAGVGGVAGYQLSDGKVGGAAAGAAVGYVGSGIMQSQVQRALSEAEKRGYDRALNQAVKQQYWIIQNQQRSRENPRSPEPRLSPVLIPETTLDGVIQKPRVEYVRVQP